MLKRKRKLTAMLLALAVLLGGLQQFTMPGVKAQAAAKTNVTAKSQAAADVKSNSVKSKNAIKKNTRTKGKLKGEDIMVPAVPVTGSAIDDDELPRMDVSIKQGDSKNIKLKGKLNLPLIYNFNMNIFKLFFAYLTRRTHK